MRVTCYLRRIRGDAMLVELAQRAGVNKGTLSAIEHGRRFPTDSEALGIEHAYGLDDIRNAYPGHVAIELHRDRSRA